MMHPILALFICAVFLGVAYAFGFVIVYLFAIFGGFLLMCLIGLACYHLATKKPDKGRKARIIGYVEGNKVIQYPGDSAYYFEDSTKPQPLKALWCLSDKPETRFKA